MCEHKFGGLLDDPERLERYQDLFAEVFLGKTALDILHRTPIPKKSSIYHHGSDYAIECTEPFRIEGVMTTALRDTKIIDKLKGLHCIILDIHHHDMLSIKSSHIHFRCENGSAEQTKDIMRFLRYSYCIERKALLSTKTGISSIRRYYDRF